MNILHNTPSLYACNYTTNIRKKPGVSLVCETLFKGSFACIQSISNTSEVLKDIYIIFRYCELQVPIASEHLFQVFALVVITIVLRKRLLVNDQEFILMFT